MMTSLAGLSLVGAARPADDVARQGAVQPAPPVIRSFLSSHALAGKKLVPFTTHGGYGLGNSQAVITKHAPRALI